MRYGTSTSTGHGHRPCTYVWKPTIYRPVQFRHPNSSRRHSRKSPPSSQSLANAFCDNLLRYFSSSTRRKVPLGYQTYLDFGDMLFRLGLVTFAIIVVGGFLSVVDMLIIKQSKKTDKKINFCRKTSVNSPPTPEALLAAWNAVRETRRNDPKGLAARLRLGDLLADLEPVVDQSYIRDEDGTIIGRRPGLKGWLGINCPVLLPHYKALMSYKTLAVKLCESMHIIHPDTLGSIGIICENDSTKILVIQESFKVEASDERVVRRAYQTLFGTGVPKSASALEEVLRVALGNVWMQRKRKRRCAA